MNDYKLFEAIADIAYQAGQMGFYSGDSRADMSDIIVWAREFEQFHRHTDWDQTDYMLAIETFARDRFASTGVGNVLK